MAYNLPNAWDPGYALPQNVKDEGLERRGFVTKQMPRGTYDAVRTGTGGYAVPKYVIDERTGRGVYVTYMMPRGTIAARIPQWIQRQPTVVGQRSIGPTGVDVTIQRVSQSGFGATETPDGEPPMPALYEDFGNKAADQILGRISMLPSAARKAQLKRALDVIDPSLWSRTAEITRRYVARGLSATESLHRALARALATGITAEVVKAGQTGTIVRQSLLGLGTINAGTVVGQTAGTTAPPNPIIVPQGVITPAGTIKIGPFEVTDSPGSSTRVAPSGRRPATREQIDFIISKLTSSKFLSACLVPGFGMGPGGGGMIGSGRDFVKPFLKMFGPIPWNKAAETAQVCSFWIPSRDILKGDIARDAALITVTHPTTGKTMGLYLGNVSTDPAKPRFDLIYARHNETIVDDTIAGVGAIVDAVKNLACSVASNPNAQAAGAAAGVAAGAGAATGQAGAAIAQSLCSPSAPTVPVVPIAPQSSSLLPLAILGGGALLAVAFLGRKRAP